VGAAKQQELLRLQDQLKASIRWRVNFENENISRFVNMVKLIHPDNVLKKGFAILSTNGKILKDDKEIIAGASLQILTEHYQINTTVNNKEERKDGKIEL